MAPHPVGPSPPNCAPGCVDTVPELHQVTRVHQRAEQWPGDSTSGPLRYRPHLHLTYCVRNLTFSHYFMVADENADGKADDAMFHLPSLATIPTTSHRL